VTIERPYQPLSDAQLYRLGQLLDASVTGSRRQGGSNLTYMEAWQVKASLITIFGYGGFSSEVLDSKIVRAVEQKQQTSDKMNHKVTAQATVRLTILQLGAIYTESAIADGTLPDWTEAADAAMKSAESDALKRCCIFLGNQFGLSLYNKDGQYTDVVGPVWSPDQAGGAQRYLQALQEKWKAQQQGQQPPQQPPVMSAQMQGFQATQQQLQTEREAWKDRVQQGMKVDGNGAAYGPGVGEA
jgi:DNA repair and recombination protein RAD52